MKLDEKGLQYQCDICKIIENGRFEGCIDLYWPPKKWVWRKDEHICFECFKKEREKK